MLDRPTSVAPSVGVVDCTALPTFFTQYYGNKPTYAQATASAIPVSGGAAVTGKDVALVQGIVEHRIERHVLRRDAGVEAGHVGILLDQQLSGRLGRVRTVLEDFGA